MLPTSRLRMSHDYVDTEAAGSTFQNSSLEQLPRDRALVLPASRLRPRCTSEILECKYRYTTRGLYSSQPGNLDWQGLMGLPLLSHDTGIWSLAVADVKSHCHPKSRLLLAPITSSIGVRIIQSRTSSRSNLH